MASTASVIYCTLVAAGFWSILGLMIAKRLSISPIAAIFVSPVLGWAAHSTLSLPLLCLVAFTPLSVGVGALLVSLVVLLLGPFERTSLESGSLLCAVAALGAAVLAVVPASAVAPHYANEAVYLAPPIFDHGKVAAVDAIARLGLPPANPFFAEADAPDRLFYYYLWHFSAAQLSILLGVSGWEADIAMTWFSAFASLAAMMGLAVVLSGQIAASGFVLVFAASASFRSALAALAGVDVASGLFAPPTGFAGWLFQSAWAPQHILAAACCILAVPAMAALAGPASSATLVFVLAVLTAAAFGSSVWIGGIVFASAGSIVAAALLARMEPSQRAPFLMRVGLAGMLSVLLASPILFGQFAAVGERTGGWPVALVHFPVLGSLMPEGLRRALDFPAYWLVLLPLEFPAIYVTGLLAALVWARRPATPAQPIAFALLILTGVGLFVPWLFKSTLGENNDLALRAVLPALFALIVFSSAACALWLREGRRSLVALALILAAASAPEAWLIARSYVDKPALAEGRVFARSAEMWASVRRNSAPHERVANNPLFLAKMTPWPVNISWAVLANRSSCFTGRELTLALTSLPGPRREAINDQFVRVFAGRGSASDVDQLAGQYQCSLAVVTVQDGAWANDPFASSARYTLVEEKAVAWRIYRRVKP